MPLKKISFSLLIIFISTIASLHAQTNDALKERIKKAAAFEDILILDASVTLHKPKGAIIENVQELIPLENDDFIIRIFGKGIYKILCYNSKGEFKNPIAEAGYDKEDYFTPSSIAKDLKGNIMIFDPPKMRINIFSPNNEFIDSINLAKPGEQIHLNSKGEIYLNVISSKENKNDFILKFDTQGKKISEFASYPFEMDAINQNIFTNHFCIDANDFIYEVSSFWPHVRKFNSSGMLLTEFGSKTFQINESKNPGGWVDSYPRYVVNMFIIDGILFVEYDSHFADVYDLEGECIRKNLAIKTKILYSSGKIIYSLPEWKENPVIRKYTLPDYK